MVLTKIPKMVPARISKMMAHRGYTHQDSNDFGALYLHPEMPPVLIDLWLEQLSADEYPYTFYTISQNRLMHRYQGILRFDARSDVLEQELDWFLSNKEGDEVKIFGANRFEEHTDPTPPEFNFAFLFEEVFGSKHLHALEQESIYFDRRGHRRFVDFVLSRTTGPVAIELNGEIYHHPLLVTAKQYASQLFKQNSLVADRFLVFRWSDRGMADRTQFADQLRDYFGDAKQFISIPKYRAQRAVSFSLLEHQSEALDKLKSDRVNEQSASLLVLPTGTGKTEIFIEDFRLLFSSESVRNALVIVPTTQLKRQTIERFKLRTPSCLVGEDVSDRKAQVVVQTSAYLLRHYKTISTDAFDYIVVDEAHRAAAHGLRKVLEHFNPRYLLGATATHERLDRRKLEDIFGCYEVDLSLEQAIQQGLLPQIRAFRLLSNISLAEVRFNGKDYVKTDLHKTVLVPSRDQLVADCLLKYFADDLAPELGDKQGVVFCVDIKHAKRMAKLLHECGISAAAVSGQDRKGLDAYARGDVRFLCACDLITEGWDAPQTSILVMARPTMSKVLYTQQLGRGTRKHPGKEALYVIDVIDAYGANIQPWSVHALFNLDRYQPFGDLITTEKPTPNDELLVLDCFWEEERRIEPINIFNFEKEYGELLNEEQLARELFVSTGTVKSWVKKGDIRPNKVLELGRQTLNYFAPDAVDAIRSAKGLKQRTDETRRDDFLEFIEQRDYTYSYKIAFLLALLSKVDGFGEAQLRDVFELYQRFYTSILNKHGKAEKKNNPLNEPKSLNDEKYLIRSMLQNPFEKFERKRFMHHCKDLSKISFDSVLWDKLSRQELEKVFAQYIQDGKDYFAKQEIRLTNEDFSVFELSEKVKENSSVEGEEQSPDNLVKWNSPRVQLQFYPDLKIACGHFKQAWTEDVETVSVPDQSQGLSASRHFVACATGNSMDGGKSPVKDGDYLLLEWIDATSAGSNANTTMAIERTTESGDQEYLLRRVLKDEHGRYVLKAFNPDPKYALMEVDEGFVPRARLKRVIGYDELIWD